MQKKMMRLDGLERVTELPPLEVWLARRLERLFPPIDCAKASHLVTAFEVCRNLPGADARALLGHLADDEERHDASCPHVRVGNGRPGSPGCELCPASATTWTAEPEASSCLKRRTPANPLSLVSGHPHPMGRLFIPRPRGCLLGLLPGPGLKDSNDPEGDPPPGHCYFPPNWLPPGRPQDRARPNTGLIGCQSLPMVSEALTDGAQNTQDPAQCYWGCLLMPILLCLADFEHLGAADRARALRGGLAVLHRHRHRVLDLALLFTLNTIRLHVFSPLILLDFLSRRVVVSASRPSG